MRDEYADAVEDPDGLQVRASKEVSVPAILPEIIDRHVILAREHLMRLQYPQGFWVGELEADISVTAGYIPLLYFMTGKLDEERVQKVVNLIKKKQNVDGSWSIFNGGGGDLSVSIQTYFALKLSGISMEELFMKKACLFIREKGGISGANVFTKIWLALFGQFDWRGTPTIPPEIILLPHWFYINIYEFASWSRATIVALSVALTHKPKCVVPLYAQLDELYIEPQGQSRYLTNRAENILSWKSFFLRVDSFCKVWEKLPFKPGRARALKKS